MPRWGFIGSGKMATALVKGMLRAGIAPAGIDLRERPAAGSSSALQSETGIAVFDSEPCSGREERCPGPGREAAEYADVLHHLRPAVTSEHLVISIAAGITIASIDEGLGASGRLVRVMPNTPALLGEGASAYAMGPRTVREDEVIVKGCLDSVGRAVRVPESLLDAVTGLSGSGPAFVYLMVEASATAGSASACRATSPRSWPLRPYWAPR